MSCYKAATDTIDALRERNEELKQQRDQYKGAADNLGGQLTALRAAIAEAEKCEPVACLKSHCIEFRKGMNDELFKQSLTDRGLDVFTHPAPVPADQQLVELVRLQHSALKTAVLTDPVYEAIEAFNKWEGE